MQGTKIKKVYETGEKLQTRFAALAALLAVFAVGKVQAWKNFGRGVVVGGKLLYKFAKDPWTASMVLWGFE